MRVVVQRVSSASVTVGDEIAGAIGRGLLALVGVGNGDTEREAHWVAHKIANLRVFSDADGRMNLSVKDVQGSVLVVPQFTLYGEVRKGFRPSFGDAAAPQIAEHLIDVVQMALVSEGVPVRQGIFQAHMRVNLINDGPVTIWIEREAGEQS